MLKSQQLQVELKRFSRSRVNRCCRSRDRSFGRSTKTYRFHSFARGRQVKLALQCNILSWQRYESEVQHFLARISPTLQPPLLPPTLNSIRADLSVTFHTPSNGLARGNGKKTGSLESSKLKQWWITVSDNEAWNMTVFGNGFPLYLEM